MLSQLQNLACHTGDIGKGACVFPEDSFLTLSISGVEPLCTSLVIHFLLCVVNVL